jgi:hypothetical protein
VKLNDALGGLLTWKLAGEDDVRGSGVPAAVVRPCALTEEAGRMPVEIDQGDTIKVGPGGGRGAAGVARWGRRAAGGSETGCVGRGLVSRRLLPLLRPPTPAARHPPPDTRPPTLAPRHLLPPP